MPNQLPHLDGVFKALADPTRRAVVARLARGPASMSELARPFGMALPSFAQHLDRLEENGIVTSVKAGRVRTYRLAEKPLRAVAHWLDAQRAHWERRFDQLDAVLLERKQEG
jgi:DNA-binding transcriptional ArsR family regulator